MAISKQKKEEILKEIKEPIDSSKFLAFVNFHGLNVAGVTEVRKLVREAGARYKVVKKTLLKKVLGETDFEGEIPSLDGETAVMIAPTEEAGLASASVLYKFAKKNKGTMQLLGGVFEKKYADSNEITALATIPPREVLLGMFVNIINSPIQGLVIALNEKAKKMEEVK